MALNLIRTWLDDPSPSIVTKMCVEMLGTAMFAFMGSAAATAAGNGIALIVVVYWGAKISGAHYNNAATLTFYLLGHITWLEMLCYWVAQVVGAAVGALWLAWLVPNLYVRDDIDGAVAPRYDGCFVPVEGLRPVQQFGWEAAGTFCFLVPVFSVVWMSQTKSGYSNVGPIIIGLSLMSAATAVGSFTGGALNPARVLGPMIVFDCPNRTNAVWYILGELAGAAATTVATAPFYGVGPHQFLFKIIPPLVHRFAQNLPAEAALEPPPAADPPARPAALELPAEGAPGEGSLRSHGMDRRSSFTLVAATPGAASTAEAGVREVRYVCLVPGAGGGGGGGGPVRRAARASVEVSMTPSPLNPHPHQRTTPRSDDAAADDRSSAAEGAV